jgi:hypothetical protein
VLLYTDVMARGGDASSASGQGGNGGGIYLGTDNDYGVLNGDARAVFDGDAQLSGGDGGNSGGEGGQFYSDSFNDGLIDGTIDASGGDATSAASYGYGGEGGVLHAVSVFGGMEFADSLLAPGSWRRRGERRGRRRRRGAHLRWIRHLPGRHRPLRR